MFLFEVLSNFENDKVGVGGWGLEKGGGGTLDAKLLVKMKIA